MSIILIFLSSAISYWLGNSQDYSPKKLIWIMMYKYRISNLLGKERHGGSSYTILPANSGLHTNKLFQPAILCNFMWMTVTTGRDYSN